MNTREPAAREALSRGWATDRVWLLPLLLLFAVKGIFFALLFAPFTGHDEVDHYFYIQRLAQGKGLGVFGKVMLPDAAAPYQKLVADFPFNAEVIQPPLYHLLMAPIYLATPGGMLAKLLVLRLVSVALGTAVVALSYLVAAQLFPTEFGVRAGATAFVALQPQLAFEAAIVNHDILVVALATLLVWLALVWSSDCLDRRRAIWLGGLLGLGMLTKVSFGLMIPVMWLIAWRCGRRTGTTNRQIVSASALASGIGLLVASPWFIRSLWLYGDPTGARQLRTIPGYGDQALPILTMIRSSSFWQGRLEDFWGNFGWRLIPFDPGTNRVIYLIWAAAGAGLVLSLGERFVTAIRCRSWALPDIDRILIPTAWAMAMIAGVLYVGTIQFTQSRFAFPGMAAFGLLSAEGYSWPLPVRLRWFVAPALLLALLALNIVVTIRFIIPFYAGAGGTAGLLP